jgi:hypothetical protein
MRRGLIILLLIFSTSVLPAQTITRQNNETAEQFIKRIQTDSTVLAHPLIETNTWDSSSKAIITLYGYDDPRDPNIGFNKIFGHLYFPTGQNKYRDILFGPIEEDGGYPEILSVFFTNADKDKAAELIVLCKHDQQHYDYSGAFYSTLIFDNPGSNNQLTYFEKLSNTFLGCECGFRDGKNKVAKYKTAKDVRTKLKKMGF